jgi:hypothetical protein
VSQKFRNYFAKVPLIVPIAILKGFCQLQTVFHARLSTLHHHPVLILTLLRLYEDLRVLM